MAYSDTIKLVTGDTLPELTFTLKDSNTAATGQTLDPENSNTWAAIDLSNGAVRLRIRENRVFYSINNNTLYSYKSYRGRMYVFVSLWHVDYFWYF